MAASSNTVPDFDPYEVLGVSRNASEDDIKRGYKRAALATHPDKAPPAEKADAEVKFKIVSEAYEVLRDPQARSAYDRYGWQGVRGTPASGSDPGPAFGGAAGYDPWGFPQQQQPQHPFFGFHPFQFHDPRMLFQELFANDPFFSAHHQFHQQAHQNHHHQRQHQHQQQHQHQFNSMHHPMFPPMFPQMFPPMMHGDPFSQMGMGLGGGSGSFSTSFSSSSSSLGGGGGGMRSSSTRTTVVNGERVTVKTISDGTNTRTETIRVARDGTETREVVENGVPVIEGGNSSTRQRLTG
ncbi:DnaJ domain-containing protein [Zopfochytrium polystomum]|nr:DnaJ domain-containing protein [Zopfochytrium polystomum]